MRYTNLIWDFDGMLFNTYPRMAAAFQQALKDVGIEESYDDIMPKIKRSVGKAAGDYAEKYSMEKSRIADQYQLREHAMPAETMIPYEGMCDLLKEAAQKGCRHYLYTHRDDGALEALEKYGVKQLFFGAITAMDHFPAKPSPDALLHIMGKYELNPSVTLMLGDRNIDVLAARNAGIEGALFDPEHFYDDFENEMRTDTVEGLKKLLGI